MDALELAQLVVSTPRPKAPLVDYHELAQGVIQLDKQLGYASERERALQAQVQELHEHIADLEQQQIQAETRIQDQERLKQQLDQIASRLAGLLEASPTPKGWQWRSTLDQVILDLRRIGP